jgi:glycosidase
MENVYEKNGYENRKDYLNCLADDYGLDRQDVYTIASMLPPSEDFDGLITTLEDYTDGMDF